MSRLKIADISFCEAELANSTQVLGGAVFYSYSPYGAWASSYDSDKSSSHVAYYYVDRNAGVIGAVAYGSTSGSVGGAVAGAISDGYRSVYVHTGAYAR